VSAELIRQGRQAEAEGRLRDACELYRRAGARLELGAVLEALGDVDGAMAEYEAIPGNVHARYNLGRLYYLRGALDRAEDLLKQADLPDARVVLAHVHRAQGRLTESAATFEAVLALRPQDQGSWCVYGMVLGALGRWADAEAALARAPAGDADALYWRGNAAAAQERPAEAAAHYRKALELQPDFAAAWCNLGHVQAELGAREEAQRCFDRALVLKPDLPDALVGIGNLHVAAERLEEAAACYWRALALDPSLAEAQLNLGHALKDQGDAQGALAAYRAALALRPQYAEARWAAAMALVPVLQQPGDDLDAFGAELEPLRAWFAGRPPELGARAVGVQQPFWLAYQERDHRDLLERYGRLCADLMARWRAPAPPRGTGGRRIGIVSQHFRSHSVWHAIVRGWLGQLDLDLCAFSLGGEEDAETAYARSHAARFEAGPRPLGQWIDAIRAARPDVLIYPEIGMNPMSLKLAALRLAPVQAASWGHPQTSGLPTIDYFLSAELLEPPGAEAHYTERLVKLPNLGCYVEPGAVRAELPAIDQPVLICPGVPFKYAPEHDAVLVEIARRLPEARLVFFTYRIAALSEKLRARLRAAGLDDARALFIPWQERAAFAGWLERATVYLDTLGFSGFNTALQAVEHGLPVVTHAGRFMRGRLAAGILARMGLDELVARSTEEYVTLAVRLVRDAKYHEAIRSQILRESARLYADRDATGALEEFLARVCL
jgi:protein O-GlcNAc transferase